MKALLICALGTGLSLSASAADTKVTVDQLPSAVRTAMREQTAGATIIGASKEREHGRMAYEVETKRNGKRRDLTFDENGSLLEVEEELDLDSVPKAAKDEILRKVAGGSVKKVESVTRGSTTSYEADVRTEDGKNREVAVNADGSAHNED